MIEHVVRRGLQHAPGMYQRAAEDPQLNIPAWGGVLLALTFLASMVFILAIKYTLENVLPTLAMVETPIAAITISHPQEPASKAEKEDLLETGSTTTLVHQKPVTSSIRGTIRHLVAESGKSGCWRGFGYYMVYHMSTQMVAAALSAILSLPMVLSIAAAGVLTANLHAAWTHKVISTPSNVRFCQRIPARSSWKLLALPAIVAAIMPFISFSIVALSFVALFQFEQFDKAGDYSGAQWASVVLRWVALFVIAFSCSLFLCLTAAVTQIRVEASILPEDQDTTVPFDRTFDGKVVSRVLGGTGAVGFLDAWRSFNWEARRRLIKLYVKVSCIVLASIFILAHILVFEMFAIVGSQNLIAMLAQVPRQGLSN